MNYEALKQELRDVSEKAPFGAHAQVAKRLGMTERNSQKIRRYDGAKMPTDKNIKRIKEMIKEYRCVIKEYIKEISE